MPSPDQMRSYIILYGLMMFLVFGLIWGAIGGVVYLIYWLFQHIHWS